MQTTKIQNISRYSSSFSKRDTPKKKSWKTWFSRSPKQRNATTYAFTDFSNVHIEGPIHTGSPKHFLYSNPPLKKWAIIRNLIAALRLFKEKPVTELDDEEDLVQDINNYQLRKIAKNGEASPPGPKYTRDAINMAKLDRYAALYQQHIKAKFFESLERGNREDLEYIRGMLLNDPKRFLLRPDHPDRIANLQDSRGERPLYIAARNGNLQLIKMLLSLEANPHLKSLIKVGENKYKEDGVLAVAARWGHTIVIEFFLRETFWEKKELEEALEGCDNDKIKGMISSHLKKYKRSFIDVLLCRSKAKIKRLGSTTTSSLCNNKI